MSNVKELVDECRQACGRRVLQEVLCINDFKLKPGALEWVELDKRQDCSEIQDYLKELTGARSVPRVFVGGKFLGGGDDTVCCPQDGRPGEEAEGSGSDLKDPERTFRLLPSLTTLHCV
ncbi:Glutaredoxin-1 protein [Aphelenchoides fujianensis]|nr:Glutaredoxin-1 protein [Aphelenchoides fujianensis]